MAQGVTFQIGPTGGLMQQPTSNYYHAVYGGYLQAATDNEGFITRLAYTERPEFRSVGFADKETFTLGMIGSKFTKGKSHGLYAFVGGGQTRGYVRRLESIDGEVNQRSFVLGGPSFSMDYAFHFGALDFGISHTLFVGYGGRTEFDARVAWPYNITLIQMALHW